MFVMSSLHARLSTFAEFTQRLPTHFVKLLYHSFFFLLPCVFILIPFIYIKAFYVSSLDSLLCIKTTTCKQVMSRGRHRYCHMCNEFLSQNSVRLIQQDIFQLIYGLKVG